MRRNRKFIALAAIAALALSAMAPVVAAKPAAKHNIVQTAAAAGQFKTLTKLLKQAGLAGTLQGKGPFTVFAPTDAAFAKVPKTALAALAKDKAKLRGPALPRRRGQADRRENRHTALDQDAERPIAQGPPQPRHGHDRRSALHQDRHRRLKRRDPRHQQGADPPLTPPLIPQAAASRYGLRAATTRPYDTDRPTDCRGREAARPAPLERWTVGPDRPFGRPISAGRDCKT